MLSPMVLISIAHRGHRHDRPPGGIHNRAEVGRVPVLVAAELPLLRRGIEVEPGALVAAVPADFRVELARQETSPLLRTRDLLREENLCWLSLILAPRKIKTNCTFFLTSVN